MSAMMAARSSRRAVPYSNLAPCFFRISPTRPPAGRAGRSRAPVQHGSWRRQKAGRTGAAAAAAATAGAAWPGRTRSSESTPSSPALCTHRSSRCGRRPGRSAGGGGGRWVRARAAAGARGRRRRGRPHTLGRAARAEEQRIPAAGRRRETRNARRPFESAVEWGRAPAPLLSTSTAWRLREQPLEVPARPPRPSPEQGAPAPE